MMRHNLGDEVESFVQITSFAALTSFPSLHSLSLTSSDVFTQLIDYVHASSTEKKKTIKICSSKILSCTIEIKLT